MVIIINFIRFTETIEVKEEKRVVSITMRPLISDSSGIIYFTDLQIQEGNLLSGYTPHTTTMLRNSKNLPQGLPAVRYLGGIARCGETVILFNLGETSAGLDCYIYPIHGMNAESVSFLQGLGSHRALFLSSASAGDELAVFASKRRFLKNGGDTSKARFFQYTAAHDSKHQVKLEDRKSARVYFEYREMLEGDSRP